MDPQLVASLVALNERTRQAWAHPHNKSFYKPASFQGFSVSEQKFREPTPSDEDMISCQLKQDTEPELSLSLNNPPKDISKGWIFGSDKYACDIYCGERSTSEEYNIGKQTFSITMNKQGNVILKHLSNTISTSVQYEKQSPGRRQEFVWIMFPGKDISVTSAMQLKFKVTAVNPDKLSGPHKTIHSLSLSRFLKAVEESTPLMPPHAVYSGSTTGESSLVSTKQPQPFYYICKDRVLGSGAFGIVYIVVDVSTGVRYAGKTFIGEFDRSEADILANQNHANILRHVALVDDDGPLLVTEYLKEGNLARPWEVNDRPPWQIDQTVRILTQCLHGLAKLHARPNSVIHQDIKPANILVADRSHGPRRNELGPWVKLADFGMAKEGTKCQGQIGTWLYSAPEVFRPGICTSKVDLWSLGVVILQLLLEGKLPDSTAYDDGVEWCKYISCQADDGYFDSLREDRDSPSKNEYSLHTFVWDFIRNSMLQVNPSNRLSASECLMHPLFLELQSASRFTAGWRRLTMKVNGGGIIYTEVEGKKKFASTDVVPLFDLGGGTTSKQHDLASSSKRVLKQDGTTRQAAHDPGVTKSVALKAPESKGATTARHEHPQPVGLDVLLAAIKSQHPEF